MILPALLSPMLGQIGFQNMTCTDVDTVVTGFFFMIIKSIAGNLLRLESKKIIIESYTGGMINVFFGKKKKEKKQEQAVPVVNKEELIAKASEKVTELESKTGDERVSLLNEIGSLYTQTEETDLAIQYYEESLELCKQHGKASTDLMKLYNKNVKKLQKRKMMKK